MKKDLCEIICILDRSGSMDLAKKDYIGGFNIFLEQQKNITNKYINVSIYLFDDKYEKLVELKNIKEVDKLNDDTFVPRGCTALLDAIGKTINTVGERLNNTLEKDRPEKVLFCILTDGEENSSKEFTISRIKEMIEHQRSRYNWEFIFLAANQDAFTEARNLGINLDFTSNWDVGNSVNIVSGYMVMSKMSASYFTGN